MHIEPKMFFLPLEVETKNLASPAEATITFLLWTLVQNRQQFKDNWGKQGYLSTTETNMRTIIMSCKTEYYFIEHCVKLPASFRGKNSFRKMVKEDSCAALFPFFIFMYS
jgi:hypothetical protein